MIMSGTNEERWHDVRGFCSHSFAIYREALLCKLTRSKISDYIAMCTPRYRNQPLVPSRQSSASPGAALMLFASGKPIAARA